jgi:hypothetical protein
MAIRVEIESEKVILGEKAHVFVYDDDRLVTEVIGEVVSQQGADGGWYPSVSLTKK